MPGSSAVDGELTGGGTERLHHHDPGLILIERTGGNPFFLEQLLLEQGRAHAQSPHLEGVPDSVQGLGLNRLDLLAPPDRLAACNASVMGQRFRLGALQYLLEDDHYRPDALLTQRLIRPEGDSFLFAHIELCYRRGDILFAQGQVDACLEAHRQGERLAPRSLNCAFWLGLPMPIMPAGRCAPLPKFDRDLPATEGSRGHPRLCRCPGTLYPGRASVVERFLYPAGAASGPHADRSTSWCSTATAGSTLLKQARTTGWCFGTQELMALLHENGATANIGV